MTKKQQTRIIATELENLARIGDEILTNEVDIDELIDNAIDAAGVRAEYNRLISRRDIRTSLKGTIEQNIRSMVEDLGESVKSTHLNAVFCEGRTTWDTNKLEGYAAAHPEINKFKNVGQSSVSIRRNK